MEGYIGEIRMFAGNFAPKSWLFCQGQLLAISTNTALFSILGTTYGGNGVNTFALPDLRGRVPVGTGQGPGLSNVLLGEVAGTPTVTLLNGNMPAHNHTITVNSDNNNMTATVANSYLSGKTESGESVASTGSALTTLNPATIGIAGGSQPFSIMQPYLGMNYIICISGIFPSRN